MIEQHVQSLVLRGYVLAPRYHDMTVEAVREYLLEQEKPIVYGLEPGDGTRYEFLITPVVEPSGQLGLYITRLGSRDPYGRTAVLWDWQRGSSAYQIQVAAFRLNIQDNPHTARVLPWFLGHLCHYFDEAAHATNREGITGAPKPTRHRRGTR